MDVAGFRSERRTDVLLGNTYGIQTELYRPFRAESRWFFAPHADASDTTFQIYAKNDPLADYRIYRINIGGDLGYSFGRSGELRVGYEVGSLNTKLRLGAYGQNEFHGNQYYLFRAGYLHDLLTLPPFLGKKVYAVGSYEFGKMYGVTTGSEFPNDVAAGLLAETALGPFFIGGSVGDSGHRKWFFQLGRVF